MRLLVAIESKDIDLINKSARWAGRAGYNLRVFVQGMDWEPFLNKLIEIGHNHYIHFTPDHLVADRKPLEYAQSEGYDLLIVIPEHRPSFTGKRKRIDLDKEVFAFSEAAGTARKAMSEDPSIDSLILARGVTMKRVIHHDEEKSTT